jgi:hypothetical protein
MKVLKLTRGKWRTFKTQNQLSKSSFFNKADVGPSVEAFANAYANFKKTRSMNDLLKASSKLTDLQKAFTKFLAIKEVKQELTAGSRLQIETWKDQLDDVMKEMALYLQNNEAKLKKNDKKGLDNTLDKCFIDISVVRKRIGRGCGTALPSVCIFSRFTVVRSFSGYHPGTRESSAPDRLRRGTRRRRYPSNTRDRARTPGEGS